MAALKKMGERATHKVMIRLTRLNHQPVFVNALVIAFIEPSSDVLITLLTGERFHVRESLEEVLEKVMRSQFALFSRNGPYREAF
jgi:uncharacterized protein YlzI (FlbEa/FlbD family)